MLRGYTCTQYCGKAKLKWKTVQPDGSVTVHHDVHGHSGRVNQVTESLLPAPLCVSGIARQHSPSDDLALVSSVTDLLQNVDSGNPALAHILQPLGIMEGSQLL